MVRREDSITRFNSKTKKSILVIDDSADLLSLLKTIFEMEGYEVFTGQSGQEALKALYTNSYPNLILLDVNLGDIRGPDFLLTLEIQMPKLFNEVAVVFFTGMDQIPKRKVLDVIRKPIVNSDIFFLSLFLKVAKWVN